LTDFAIYAGLFLSAFTSATLLPGSSEAALLALLATGRGEPVSLVVVATAGNVIGSSINWVLGRFFSTFRDKKWFPVTTETYERAVAWYRRYGAWSLLLSWLPVIGDPLTVAAGALRVGWGRFLLLVSLGKAGRYAFLAVVYYWWNA
jgi:membrane protein YqaA with SNARE-associated domain